ncbi:MAG: FHA domain-containing protein [Planctomycetaceae bacterium]|nr:FHA domain-containing protein [Planctomycetaceae bacterium]
MTTSRLNEVLVARIHWLSARNALGGCALSDGQSLTFGSGAECEIQLDDADVHPKHGVIWAEQGTIYIRDYYHANSLAIAGEFVSMSKLRPNMAVQIGNCRLVVQATDDMRDPVSLFPDVTTISSPQPMPMLAEETPRPVESREDRLLAKVRQLEFDLQSANAEIDILRERTQSLSSLAEQPALESDPFQEELIELLRAEIVELQQQLAVQGFAQPAERHVSTSPSGSHGAAVVDAGSYPLPAAANDDTVVTHSDLLETRLEELLNELEIKDEQVALLEELLQSSEALQQATQSEKQQLDQWMADVEQRFVSREEEWKAQTEKLQATILQLQQQQASVQSHLLVKTDDSRLQALQRVNQNLHEEIEQVRTALQTAERAHSETQQHLEQLRISTRAEAVQISQERAELARLKFEIDSARQKLQERAQARTPQVDRQLKQILKEHDPKPTLTDKIAWLWRQPDDRS